MKYFHIFFKYRRMKLVLYLPPYTNNSKWIEDQNVNTETARKKERQCPSGCRCGEGLHLLRNKDPQLTSQAS